MSIKTEQYTRHDGLFITVTQSYIVYVLVKWWQYADD